MALTFALETKTNREDTEKMKRLLITLSLLLASSALSQELLPDDSRELLTKLQGFSEQALAKAKALIAEKEGQVVEVLEKHLQRETKAGNLQTALALKNEIDRIKNQNAITESSPSKSEPAEVETGLEFVGVIWDNGTDQYVFNKDGTGLKTWNDKTFKLGWKVIEDGVVEMTGGGQSRYWRFRGNRSAFNTVGSLDGTRVEYQPRRK